MRNKKNIRIGSEEKPKQSIIRIVNDVTKIRREEKAGSKDGKEKK